MAVYVVSDIHGLMGRFLHLLEMISFQDEDKMYILGDVIDRGSDGIALLQYIKKQKNMQLLMGNHEHMMMEYMRAEEAFHKGKSKLENMVIMRRWDMNHNEKTKADFYDLAKSEQKELLSYISELPLAYPRLVVNDRRYYLVHATPHPLSYQEDVITLSWCKKHSVDPYTFIWERNDGEITLPQDTTLIFGHTITGYYHLRYPYEIWTAGKPIQESNVMDIDCGCAANNDDSRLCCVRLDDREVFYG